ncbi:MAG: hypothetical protein HY368_02770 [Candidatus Aenigmarchaeota archaeon]|nr:hypothetical protein [Candidatus Aenigmarchaeota archaeon]
MLYNRLPPYSTNAPPYPETPPDFPGAIRGREKLEVGKAYVMKRDGEPKADEHFVLAEIDGNELITTEGKRRFLSDSGIEPYRCPDDTVTWNAKNYTVAANVPPK